MFPSGAEETASGSDGVSRSALFTSPALVNIIFDVSRAATNLLTLAVRTHTSNTAAHVLILRSCFAARIRRI